MQGREDTRARRVFRVSRASGAILARRVIRGVKARKVMLVPKDQQDQ